METAELLWEIDDYTLPATPFQLNIFPALEQVVVATPLVDGDLTWISLLDLETGQSAVLEARQHR